jgi:hypothetical protein
MGLTIKMPSEMSRSIFWYKVTDVSEEPILSIYYHEDWGSYSEFSVNFYDTTRNYIAKVSNIYLTVIPRKRRKFLSVLHPVR